MEGNQISIIEKIKGFFSTQRTNINTRIRVDDSVPSRNFFETHKNKIMCEKRKLTPYVNGKKVRIWKFIGYSNEHSMYVPLFYKNDRRRIDTKDSSINTIDGFPSKLDYPFKT